MPFYPATDIVPGGKRRVGSNATPLHSRENHAPPPTDKVQAEGILLDGEPVEFPDGLYAALYKPEGYTCSHDDGEGDLIYDLLPFQWRNRNPAVSSVGRLDKETSGLLLLTDDGKFIHRMTSPPPSRRQSLRSRHGGGHSDRSRRVVRLRNPHAERGKPAPAPPPCWKSGNRDAPC